MKRILIVLVVIALCLTACAAPKNEPTKDPVKAVDSSASVEKSSEEGSDEVPFEERGYKIAYILNGTATDIFKMAFDAAVEEGAAIGIKVDCFTADGDDLRFQDIINQCALQGYDGLFISHGKNDYSYDLIKPLADKGIEIVTFDTVVKDPEGNVIPGVTTMFQDDFEMARLSLDYICNDLCKDVEGPVKLLKLWRGPGIPPFDRRQSVYQEYEDAGKIVTLELLGPSDPKDSEGTMNQVTASVLPKYPEGTVDAVWSAYDAYGRGTYKALLEANRTDIPLVSIDISNQDINLMLEEDGIWKACVAVHFPNIGEQGIRLLAMKLHGDDTPDEYNLKPSLVVADDLAEDSNVTNLGETVPGYGQCDDHLEDWMKEIIDNK